VSPRQCFYLQLAAVEDSFAEDNSCII
jgi:hypothetical protein